MKTLYLHLLGTPQILLDDQPLTGFATSKAKALLFYLAVTAHTGAAQPIPHSRDTLATLLWSELADTQAKQNLRTVLPDLRRLVGDYVQVDRQSVTFDRTCPHWLDVEELRRGLAPSPAAGTLAGRQAVVDLYQGEFLQDFYVHDAPLFEAWVVEQREQIHTLVVNALTALVSEYAQTGNAVAALAANRRLLRLDPWSEPMHRQQMRLLAQTGDRAAALAQYETCRRVLADEFGIEPMPETTALYDQIRQGEITRAGDGIALRETALRAGKQGDRAQGGNAAGLQREAERAPSPQEPAAAGAPVEATAIAPDVNGTTPATLPRLQVAGDNLPLRTKLFGRQTELAHLQQWISEDGCQLVGILGIGGQGKTALAATLVRNLAEATPPPTLPQRSRPMAGAPWTRFTSKPEGGTDGLSTGTRLPPQSGEGWGGVRPFTRIIWQSLLNAPTLTEVMQAWVYLLSDQTVTSLPTSLDQQFSQLFAYLQRQRCLLVLDNLESILQGEGHGGYYRPGYEAYGQLLQQWVAGEHRSCLLITSREQPHNLAHLAEATPTVRFLALAGLPADAGQAELQARGVVGRPADLAALVQHYSGNPLALKLVADTIDSLFDGDIAAFLQADTLVFDDIRHVLDQQLARLTALERELLLWLAILREPVPFNALRTWLAQPPAGRSVLEAARSLQRRSLLEKFDEGFGLQNVVLEYATALLIENVVRELLHDNADKVTGLLDTNVTPSYLNRYALILAQTKEYVRASQTRLLLQPVAERLLDSLGRTGAEQQLQRLLVQVRTAPTGPGYAAANLLHLLLQLGVELRGYDFSQLYLRQAHLRGVSLPQVNFTGTQMRESVFTEPFGLVYTAVFSPDGAYVAAGTSEGAIYIWRTADQQLAHVFQAHQQAVKQLTFVYRTNTDGAGAAPPLRDGALRPHGDRHLVLASASDDKQIGLWSLAEPEQVRQHSQLAHAQQGALIAVSLHPDGQRVTGVDINGQVFVWDVGDHHAAQLVQHFATAFTRFRLVGFSGDGQTVAIGHRDGVVRLWQAATGVATLSLTGQTGLIFSLALRQDGGLLVTGGREGHLCCWRLPAGELQQVIATKAGAINVLAFSPDGKFLASGHEDLTLRLWTFDAQGQLQLHHTLLGHAQTIWSVVFGPSPTAQQTPRPANEGGAARTATRQLLVTGSSDQTVRVWDVETGHLLYLLRGQPRVLAAHTLSPLPQTQLASSATEPGWLLAAAGYDQLIHVWQGQGHQADGTRLILRGARGPLYAVAFSPDGRSVAGGGYDRTIYLWDRASGQLRQTFHGHTNRVYTLVFHPDGKRLASGSGDGTVRLWALPEGEWSPGRGVDGFAAAQPIAVIQADLDVVHDLAFSPDGRVLARGGTDRMLRLWDMTQRDYPELVTARRLVQDESEEDILAIAFSPDGSKVACSGNHLIHLVDLQNSEAPLIMRGHTAWIYSVAFSPDGATLASSADSTVWLWDVASGALRATLRGHSETVYRVAFTPDGTAIVSSSFDGTIKFWNSQSSECLNTLTVEGPYAGMKINDVTGLTQAQKMALKALGAVEA